jgi:hypothetical protein
LTHIFTVKSPPAKLKELPLPQLTLSSVPLKVPTTSPEESVFQ